MKMCFFAQIFLVKIEPITRTPKYLNFSSITTLKCQSNVNFIIFINGRLCYDVYFSRSEKRDPLHVGLFLQFAYYRSIYWYSMQCIWLAWDKLTLFSINLNRKKVTTKQTKLKKKTVGNRYWLISILYFWIRLII